MQLSMRAAVLRTAMERATGQTAVVSERTGWWRLTVEVPPECTPARYGQLLSIVQQGDDWGSSGHGGIVTIWSEVRGEQAA